MPIANPDIYPGTPGTPLYAGRVTPGAGGLVTSFVLENWNAVGSTAVLWRGGMPFKKGDVPAGQALEIRRGGVAVAAQFDERSTWSDGSLKFAVCHMRDTTLAASASNTYEIHAVAGSFNNTGATSLATVAASEALTVELSSLTQFNGTTNVTRGAGAALGSFATHAAVATRVTKIHSGPVCDGWQVWGMVKDGAAGAGAEDAHLKCIWYVDAWKDAGGAVIDVEHAVEVAQDWWAVASKFRLDYTATYKRGATTVETYAAVQHPYHAHWITVRKTDDNNHAKRHRTGAMPTLNYVFSKTYWKFTKVLPPYDTTYVPASSSAASYVPLSSQNHRANIDEGGGYQGRGVLSNFDAKAFMRQSAFDSRVARVNGMAGLHIPYHYKDERTRTRSGESADVANTLIPLLWEPKAASASTFAGLPAPKHAYRGGATPGDSLGGWVAPTGGSGVWTTSNDASHAVAYSTGAYLFEGERYMLNATIGLATYYSQALNGNVYGGRPWLHWYENASARSEMSIPATVWGGLVDVAAGQERALGLALNILGHAAALSPNADEQGQYLKSWNAHCGDYISDCLTYTPPNALASGITYMGNTSMRSPWMAGIIIQGCYYNAAMNEVPAFASYASMVCRLTAGLLNRSLYDLGAYRSVHAEKQVSYSLGTNPYFAPNNFLSHSGATVSGNRVSSSTYYPTIAGEEVYFLTFNDGASTLSVPPEVVEGQKLYVVAPDATSFGVALTPGGAAISLTAGSNYAIGGRFYGASAVTVATLPPYLPPGGDTYWGIQMAAFAFAERASSPDVPAGSSDAVRAFLAGVDRTNYPAWEMKAGA